MVDFDVLITLVPWVVNFRFAILVLQHLVFKKWPSKRLKSCNKCLTISQTPRVIGLNWKPQEHLVNSMENNFSFQVKLRKGLP